MSISDNVAHIRERIAAAAQRSGRAAGEITLVAVTKTHAAEAVQAAIDAGIADCGENRVQEAETKIPLLPPGARWHLIGNLQRNKARRAAALFDMVQSVDSLRLALALDRALGDAEPRRLPVLLELNVAGEASKAGFAAPRGSNDPAAYATLREVVERIAALPWLEVQGLMTVAPFVNDPEQVRWVFRALRGVRDELHRDTGLALPHLSMGMSDDFEVAIEEGATIVRIGRAIFGERAGTPGQ